MTSGRNTDPDLSLNANGSLACAEQPKGMLQECLLKGPGTPVLLDLQQVHVNLAKPLELLWLQALNKDWTHTQNPTNRACCL